MPFLPFPCSISRYLSIILILIFTELGLEGIDRFVDKYFEKGYDKVRHHHHKHHHHHDKSKMSYGKQRTSSQPPRRQSYSDSESDDDDYPRDRRYQRGRDGYNDSNRRQIQPRANVCYHTSSRVTCNLLILSPAAPEPRRTPSRLFSRLHSTVCSSRRSRRRRCYSRLQRSAQQSKRSTQLTLHDAIPLQESQTPRRLGLALAVTGWHRAEDQRGL